MTSTEKDLFHGLRLRSTPQSLLMEVHGHYSFLNKRVLEIGSDYKLQVAQAMLRLGATEVVAVNPDFKEHLFGDVVPGVTPIKDLGENIPYGDGYFDIIFGVALLEHVHNPRALADKCRRLLHKNGVCFLHGSPVWTSCQGHHTTLIHENRFYSYDGRSPYEPWEHLGLDTPEKAALALAKKGIAENDIPCLITLLLEDKHISRLTPIEIIRPFTNMKDMAVRVKRVYASEEKNSWYQAALKNYSKDDLETKGIVIKMRYATGAGINFFQTLWRKLYWWA